ncbi:MAG: hypothetical protein KDD37_11130 [Bdellovibrionales bacterium]|nr:hypothetical protein [Bdellovibrionales bacterium]
MNTNTIIMAIALTLVANGAYAARSAGSRGGAKAETRVERDRLREKEKQENPNAVDNATSRQKTANKVEAEAKIDQALNGAAVSKSITSREGLLALNESLPLSKIPDVVNDLVLLENTLLNRAGGDVAVTTRIVSNALKALDAYGKEMLSNPKFRSEKVKQEIADLMDVIQTEVKDATTSGKWPKERLRNLENWADALVVGAQRGLSPKEATDLHAKFTWEELLKRCKKGKA